MFGDRPCPRCGAIMGIRFDPIAGPPAPNTPGRTIKSFRCASCRMEWGSCPKCQSGVLVEVVQQADLFWRRVAEKHVHCVGGCGVTR
jgi:hypothetical protein